MRERVQEGGRKGRKKSGGVGADIRVLWGGAGLAEGQEPGESGSCSSVKLADGGSGYENNIVISGQNRLETE